METKLSERQLALKLSEVLNRVRDGEQFIVERDGERLAVLSPPVPEPVLGITGRELAARIGHLKMPSEGSTRALASHLTSLMARIIDANVFIELERSGGRLSDIVAGADGELHALASITAAELLYGVERPNTSERRRRRSEFVESILQTIPIVPLDVTIARVQAKLWANLERTGDRIGPFDMVVAATALAQGFDVLTFNVREFERVPGLGVVRPDC
jgi:tRNA(fMet)-specific endonuclease VapC